MSWSEALAVWFVAAILIAPFVGAFLRDRKPPPNWEIQRLPAAPSDTPIYDDLMAERVAADFRAWLDSLPTEEPHETAHRLNTRARWGR